MKDWKGKDADQPVYKALVEQMNSTCKQAAIEVGQWSEKRAITATFDLAERLRAARRRKAERQTQGNPAAGQSTDEAETVRLRDFGT